MKNYAAVRVLPPTAFCLAWFAGEEPAKAKVEVALQDLFVLVVCR